MEIDSIGSSTSGIQQSENSTVSQDEFIKLFLAQLQYQDPLEPLNNREFLAQLAQFSVLEQSRLSNENLSTIASLNSSDQALSLLAKEVEVETDTGGKFNGVIEAVHYSTQGASLTIKNAAGEFLDNISLGQVRIVQQ